MGAYQARLNTVTVGDHEPVAIMGVINLDPHSFYQGSYYRSLKKTVSAVTMMIEDGVDIIDIGGVSTAPGSQPISIEEEKKRVLEPIKQIVKDWDVSVSIDTQDAQVAQAALTMGASIVNDVSGLKSDPNMAKIIQDAGASCVLMASDKQPGDRHKIPQIISALQQSLEIAQAANISRKQIVVDPGLGFGKPFECDLGIIRHLRKLRMLKRPILLGVSRKNFIGKVLDYPSPQNRLYGTLAAVVISILEGAHVIRAHDIRATSDCIKMVSSFQNNHECE